MEKDSEQNQSDQLNKPKIINDEEKNLKQDENNLRTKKQKKRERSPPLESSTISTISTSSAIIQNNISNNNSNSQNNLATNTTNIASTIQAQNSNQPVKKEKQKPETWNKIEQQIFFNALRQNGKNFESITQYFNARQKKYKIDDGVNVQRSREQIRHFYYRTWHKVIKYITIPILKENQSDSAVPNNKNSNTNANNNNNNNSNNSKIIINVSDCSLRDMQVKCLIAYNALMNKSHRWNKKTAIKLVELINHGWTTVREKGKITRLRMPLCKLSSKSASIDIETTNNSLPETLNIQLEPNSESAYCRVHRLAQNPFLNIELQSLQTVKYLIEFLENKWKNRRNQFLEKFKIDNEITKSGSKSSHLDQVSSLTESDDNENSNSNNNNNNTKKRNDQIKQNNVFTERLIIYPSETDQLTAVDLSEANNIILNNLEPEQNLNQVENESKSNENDLNLIKDDPMGIDDCAVNPDNFLSFSSKTNLNQPQKNLNCLNPEQIKSGLTLKNSFILINGKDKKELTFIQLYLAFKKPTKIKLKYDWIICSNNDNNSEINNQTQITNNNPFLHSQSSSSCSSSSIQTLSSKQNMQQRFYIDTLANVAASFLNEIQKTKESQSNQTSSSTSNQKNEKNLTNNTNNLFKSPPKPISASQQSIAFLQPINSPKQATILPMETVLQKLNEEQTNKTKKLLSDLNSKRRSRQRKPIMVVNTSHPPRTMLPKLNFINSQQLFLNSPNSTNEQQNSIQLSIVNNEQQPQQNIVYSGPMAAIARQIVNNSASSSPQTTDQLQQFKFTNSKNNQNLCITNQQEDVNRAQSPKIIISSIQQSYSNLIPQILNNLIENNQSSDSESVENKNEKNTSNDNNNLNNPSSPQNLTNMSLLELSINNADSLFGNSVVRVNFEQSNQINNSNKTQSEDIQFNTKLNNNNKKIFNENSLNNLLSSITAHKTNVIESNNNQANTSTRSNSNLNSGTGVSLSHRRSDLIVEWTESMNDVSLTGCLLNEIQSPEKLTKNSNIIHSLNENSRDSIFLNMDTLMDIIPSGLNRYDESSLLNTSNNTLNTIDNIQTTSRT